MWPLQHGVVLFPSRPEEYGTDADLIGEIRSFLHRYVDLNPVFEQIAAYYVLFAWVYDRFNELPYLRVRGDAGRGKRRFLLTVGSLPLLQTHLCQRGIYCLAIFRLIDTFKGTLVVDESDWKQTDERV